MAVTSSSALAAARSPVGALAPSSMSVRAGTSCGGGGTSESGLSRMSSCSSLSHCVFLYLHVAKPDVEMPKLPWKLVGVPTSLLTFFLVFYSGNCYSRYYAIYFACMDCRNAVFDCCALATAGNGSWESIDGAIEVVQEWPR